MSLFAGSSRSKFEGAAYTILLLAFFFAVGLAGGVLYRVLPSQKAADTSAASPPAAEVPTAAAAGSPATSPAALAAKSTAPEPSVEATAAPPAAQRATAEAAEAGPFRIQFGAFAVEDNAHRIQWSVEATGLPVEVVHAPNRKGHMLYYVRSQAFPDHEAAQSAAAAARAKAKSFAQPVALDYVLVSEAAIAAMQGQAPKP